MTDESGFDLYIRTKAAPWGPKKISAGHVDEQWRAVSSAKYANSTDESSGMTLIYRKNRKNRTAVQQQ